MKRCPHCGYDLGLEVPPEPPVGTWMRDRHGGIELRQKDGWGVPSTMPYGRWEAMWRARGPYVPCGPWGIGGEIQTDIQVEGA